MNKQKFIYKKDTGKVTLTFIKTTKQGKPYFVVKEKQIIIFKR